MTENVSRTRDDLVARLKRAGELQVSGDNQAELDSYFDTRQFRFHGPDGFETEYAGLANYFKAIRAAFDDRSIRRGIIVAEANYIACQTWIEGTFVREFTESPAGALVPNGRRVVWISRTFSGWTIRGDSSRNGYARTTEVSSGSSELRENSHRQT